MRGGGLLRRAMIVGLGGMSLLLAACGGSGTAAPVTTSPASVTTATEPAVSSFDDLSRDDEPLFMLACSAPDSYLLGIVDMGDAIRWARRVPIPEIQAVGEELLDAPTTAAQEALLSDLRSACVGAGWTEELADSYGD